jgi:FlaA1/EpsC-like NDP-sugar epimerase
VLEFTPAELVVVERAENRLYEIMLELQNRVDPDQLIPHVADINDADRMDQIFSEQRPEVVFHAAAYKQVPLMELFPEEATRNNVFGTRILAELADRHGVEAFVMISTDKAVRPSSVMGATKRIAEILVQCFARRSNTSFMTVRFGNVLGSDGSVVPVFQKQIENGGPVTVTHPDMTRYFMTIQEASRLVMQAAALGRSGDIMVLNMGEPVKIVDLARAMITLAGAIPEEGISITYTGLRPGEKLTEELFDEEGLTGSQHENILVARATEFDWETINGELQELHELAFKRDREKLLEKIREILPTFRSETTTVQQYD